MTRGEKINNPCIAPPRFELESRSTPSFHELRKRERRRRRDFARKETGIIFVSRRFCGAQRVARFFAEEPAVRGSEAAGALILNHSMWDEWMITKGLSSCCHAIEATAGWVNRFIARLDILLGYAK